ncbi:MAG: efflux RND transporter periplasmic adaptor subunit [Bacteroidales bacterium]|nr:efflux RND transporter periplasmic adaptor subunit [Bacteroidales bacterium]MBO5848404.1 efflux RND transporter periplasmic adaptor subunit [Bacteroidales bacterium]
MKSSNRILFVLFIVILLIILTLSILGIFLTKEKDIVLQGQIEADEYNISGLLPGRIEKIYVEKGEKVRKGDTLIHIVSKEVIAEYEAQKALENAASLQSEKIDAGSRNQLISITKELWEGAKSDLKLAKTTYNRIKILHEDSIVSQQRKDEAEAIYKSALAAERAAYYQYQIALEGAQEQDKATAKAMAVAAQNNSEVVKALLNDARLTSPISGEVATISLNEGELTSIGTNIMTVLDIDNPYLVLNVREDLLSNFKMGGTILCNIPAIDLKDIPFIVNYISPLGSFATWKATKETGGYDLRTFEIQAVPMTKVYDLRPGMSVLITISN